MIIDRLMPFLRDPDSPSPVSLSVAYFASCAKSWHWEHLQLLPSMAAADSLFDAHAVRIGEWLTKHVVDDPATYVLAQFESGSAETGLATWCYCLMPRSDVEPGNWTAGGLSWGQAITRYPCLILDCGPAIVDAQAPPGYPTLPRAVSGTHPGRLTLPPAGTTSSSAPTPAPPLVREDTWVETHASAYGDLPYVWDAICQRWFKVLAFNPGRNRVAYEREGRREEMDGTDAVLCRSTEPPTKPPHRGMP